MKFYKCEVCGNILEMIVDSSRIPNCCNKTLVELVPNTIDASKEKHVPMYWIRNNTLTVQIGENLHPSEVGHYIQFIEVKTNKKIMRKMLYFSDVPKTDFELSQGEEVEEIYAYCNLHGLWRTN